MGLALMEQGLSSSEPEGFRGPAAFPESDRPRASPRSGPRFPERPGGARFGEVSPGPESLLLPRPALPVPQCAFHFQPRSEQNSANLARRSELRPKPPGRPRTEEQVVY